VLGRQVIRGARGNAAPAAGHDGAVIEIRAVSVGGTIRATTPRRSRWRPALRRR
jgi:hypothetical protein